MRSLSRLGVHVLAVTAALSPRMALSQSEFVGTIHYDALNKGKHIDMVVTTDGVRLRYDVVPADSIRQGYGFTRIVDGAKRELTVLTPNTRHYRVFPLRPADSLTVQRPDDQRDQRGMEGLTITGRHELIAGVDCELFLFRGDEFCLTTALGRMSPLEFFIGDTDPIGGAALVRMQRNGAIMLRMRWNSADPPVTITATRIEHRQPSLSVFTVPPGYERYP